jgi:ATP-dependent Clp protease ATP-binding subunit ClpA
LGYPNGHRVRAPEALNAELEARPAAGPDQRAAEIRYGELVQLEKNLKQGQLDERHAKGSPFSEEVTAQEIAEVVSKWTSA